MYAILMAFISIVVLLPAPNVIQDAHNALELERMLVRLALLNITLILIKFVKAALV